MGGYPKIRIGLKFGKKISLWRQNWIKQVRHTQYNVYVVLSHRYEVQRQANTVSGDRCRGVTSEGGY